ncbi:MAG: hypothetical protein JWN04_4665, partial [Myxococcaceae bacterium]|nr:hypothetical protein [Myxococcaceae bacterium]
MSYIVCAVLLAPAVVLMTLILAVAIRPSASSGLAEVLRAVYEPLKAVNT